MGIPERDEEIDPEKRAELQRRLEELRGELESLARNRMRWPDGAPLHLQDRSEALEVEADAIRARLGMPSATGRPPRGSGWGWLALIAASTAILIGVFALAR